MKNQTKRRSVVGRTLMLIGAMFAMGAGSGATGKTKSSPMAAGMGWGSGAIYSPKRGAFKGYMRDPQYRAKRKTK